MTHDEEEVLRILEGREYPSLDIAFEEAKRVLGFQFAQIDGLDTKASILIGFSAVLLTLFLTVMPGMIRRSDVVTSGVLIGSFISVVMSLAFAIAAIRLKTFSNIPSIESLIDKYLGWQEKHTKYHMLFEFKRAFNGNRGIIKPKIRWVGLSLVSLEIGIVLCAIVLLCQVWLIVQP